MKEKHEFIKMAEHRVFLVPFAEHIYNSTRSETGMIRELTRETIERVCQVCGEKFEGDPWILEVDI